MKWIRYGPNALLLRFAEEAGEDAFALSQGILHELENHPPRSMTDYVPAFTTILIEFDPREAGDLTNLAAELMAQLSNVRSRSSPQRPVKEIPVDYNGPDLDRVARRNQLTAREVC